MLRQILRRDLMAGALKAGVQFWAACAQGWDGALNLFFPIANAGVDFLLVGKVERDRSIHLLQAQRSKILANVGRKRAITAAL
jgi:hypothetical protein